MLDKNKYNLEFTPEFLDDYKKLIKKNTLLAKKFSKSLKLLADNPQHNSLKSHKVNTINNEDVWSSWITGDVRVIWLYHENRQLVIVLLEAGTHSGSKKLYKKSS